MIDGKYYMGIVGLKHFTKRLYIPTYQSLVKGQSIVYVYTAGYGKRIFYVQLQLCKTCNAVLDLTSGVGLLVTVWTEMDLQLYPDEIIPCHIILIPG